MGTLLVILSIVAVLWLLRRLFPLLLIWLIARQAKRQGGAWSAQFGGQGPQAGGRSTQSTRKEGEVTVESAKVEKTVNKSVGEYVEYEEE